MSNYILRKLDILCIGEPLYELNQNTKDLRYDPGFGGDTSNLDQIKALKFRSKSKKVAAALIPHLN